MAVNTPSDSINAEAGPSVSRFTPGPSAYHESSQFRNWRYSTEQLSHIRKELNERCVEVVTKNQELERKAQIELNHNPPNNSTSDTTTYLTVEDELLLLRFYCIQVSKICRHGFGLPEQVEATAISYLKRFYLKNSIMEWHPKTIMPTCLFLAAKTTNYPVLIDAFIPKFAKLQASDVISTEFLVAQSLNFEFWVRGAEKGARGWFLEFQEQPNIQISTLQSALPNTLLALSRSRLTDLEFTHTPSQIALGAWYTSSPNLVKSFLEWRYEALPTAYGMTKDRLEEILDDIKGQIENVGLDDSGEIEVDIKAVRGVDKRLKRCENPLKTPGTALYLQHKQNEDAAEAAERTTKSLKASRELADREMVFGDVIQTGPGGSHNGKRKPLSPMITIPSSPNPFLSTSAGGSGKKLKFTIGGEGNKDGIGKGDNGMKIEEGGMGVKDESMGYVVGGKGLKEVGKSLGDDDD